ncbi:MAG: hypothetical protein MJ206_02035 [Bacilli bacterium]|nr:hypothetical protein [Bacilli bacterium]
MKKQILVILASTLLITACQKKEPDYYTITIAKTDQRFMPNKSSFTFKRNDFTPIVVPYTIEEDFIPVVVSSDVEGSYCTFDYENQEITIYPQVNANFTVTVSITRVSIVSYVTITNSDKHFKPFTKSVPYVPGTAHPVIFSYQIDQYCAPKVELINGEATYTFTGNRLNVVPDINEDADILIEVTTDENYKTFSFKGNGGFLSPGSETEIAIPFGGTWKNYVDPSIQTAIKDEYDFKGWSFGKNPTDELISKDFTITQDIEVTTVYAIYYHHIHFIIESPTMKLSSQIYESDFLSLNFALQNTERYHVPSKDDINFYVNDNAYSRTKLEFEYTYNESLKTILIKFPNYQAIPRGTILVDVNDYQPQYEVLCTFLNLTSSIQEGQKAKKGDPLVFQLFAEEPYQVPMDITITIGESTIPLILNTHYKIDRNPPSKEKITIFEGVITDKVNIFAQAI